MSYTEDEYIDGMAPTVYVYRAMACKGALKLWTKGLKINRRTKLSDLLRTASAYTAVTYPRSKAGAEQAIADLEEWINLLMADMEED